MKKTILITGSTDGIGKLAAIKLAKAGHAVFLHGRNPEKLARVIAEVKRLTGTDEVDGFVADFSDLAAVGSMATEVSEALPVLDVLINNAGVYKSSQAKSKAGYDLRFAVNYLAPFTLTEGLLPLLRASGTARVINLSSAAQAPVDVAALKGSVLLPTQSAYAQSKL
ncbi:MAG: SDR family NAD(P)-dependent oxidoreductase, partial [Bacteroidota bacterium]